jgi:cytochrome c-type biogenesis protein CcmF
MIVHFGVVVIAVALAAASSYGQRTQLLLKPGQSVRFDGHSFTYLGARRFSLPNKSGEIATVLVDGARFYPAISVFPGSEGIGTPAVDSSVSEDTYLTVANIEFARSGPATIDVVIQPMVLWLWVGGGITAFGAVLAAIPGRRRRASGSRPGSPGSIEVGDSPDGSPIGRPNDASDPPAPSEPGLEPAPVGAGANS